MLNIKIGGNITVDTKNTVTREGSDTEDGMGEHLNPYFKDLQLNIDEVDI